MTRIVFPRRRAAGTTLPEIMAGYDDPSPIPGLPIHRGDPAATAASLEAWLTRRGSDFSDVCRIDADTVMSDRDEPGGGTIGQTMIPTLLERILRRVGVDPRAYAVLALLEPGTIGLGDVTIEVECERRRIRTVPDDYRMHLEPGFTLQCSSTLAGGIEWNMNAHVIDLPGHLPGTVMGAMAGQPLRRLLSHPLLDHLDVGIDEVFHDGPGTTIYYDHAMARVSLDEIRPLD